MVYYKDLTANEVYGYDETEESQLPYIQKAINNGWENITGSYPLPPMPSTANKNKAIAVNLLTATDWTTVADVANPINSPYLANQAAFISYRNEIRKIAVDPIAGDIVWATQPVEVWAYTEI
jgi:hypothetical protein